MPGWSYSYFANFVHLSQSGEAWEWVNGGQCNAAGTVWVSWFVRLLATKGSQAMPVRSTIDTRGIALVAQARKRAPEAWERQESSTANYETRQGQKLQWCYSTQCRISELHAPVVSQHKLERISPPVGRPIVTRTYLVPAFTSRVVFRCMTSDLLCYPLACLSCPEHT